MIPTYTRFAATTAGPTATKGPVMPPFDGRKGPHESVKRPTAWSTRKSAAKGISPVYAWPLTLAFVGAGAFYMYSAFVLFFLCWCPAWAVGKTELTDYSPPHRPFGRLGECFDRIDSTL